MSHVWSLFYASVQATAMDRSIMFYGCLSIHQSCWIWYIRNSLREFLQNFFKLAQNLDSRMNWLDFAWQRHENYNFSGWQRQTTASQLFLNTALCVIHRYVCCERNKNIPLNLNLLLLGGTGPWTPWVLVWLPVPLDQLTKNPWIRHWNPDLWRLKFSCMSTRIPSRGSIR